MAKKENKKTNAWGIKYVEKYIRESNTKGCVGYVVFIHRNDLQVNERFETIEKARQFRDEVLRLCELKRIEEVKVDLNIRLWPFNLIESVGFDIESVINNFEQRLETCGLTEKEYHIIIKYYREMKTLQEIGDEWGITRERVRQIMHKGLRRMKHRQAYFEIGEYQNKEQLAKQEYEKFLQEKYQTWTYESAQQFIKDYELLGGHSSKTSLDLEIDELDLSVRSYNCLKRGGIQTVRDIVEMAWQLPKLRNLGKKSLKEIKDRLKEYDIEINTEPEF